MNLPVSRELSHKALKDRKAVANPESGKSRQARVANPRECTLGSTAAGAYPKQQNLDSVAR
jgi:hypothetical protein